MLANGLSAPTHSVYLGVLWMVLMEVLLFFLSSTESPGSLMVRPLVLRSMSARVRVSGCLSLVS